MSDRQIPPTPPTPPPTERPHPREILRVLEQRARRRFGQHFLARPDIVSRMVRGAGVQPGDRVIEIGPGLGILTAELLQVGARLTAVELDRDLAAYVVAQFPDVQVVEGDAAKIDWGALCGEGGWKVVSNLPYNVGTGIVIDLLRRPDLFRSLTVMLQREVVDRLLALPGSKTYGALSVIAQVRARGRFLMLVPPAAFHPPPKVQSSVVHFEPYPEPDAGPAGLVAFERVVRAAFSQRRKTLVNALGPLYGREEARHALVRAGIDPGLRAETLGLPEFRALAAELHPVLDPGLDPVDAASRDDESQAG